MLWMWYLEPPVSHWAGALQPAALTLPGTFHLLFWSFLTLFLERDLSFFPPSVTLPTLPARSRGIWCQELYLKGSIPGSRSVSHSAALAKGHTWGRGGSRAVPRGMGVRSGQAPGDRELESGFDHQLLTVSYLSVPQTSLLLNAVIPALGSP